MKQFKEQLIESITSILEIYEPYKDHLLEKEVKDLAILELVHAILCSGNIPDRSVSRKNELAICEKDLV
jgi:hypothetical protein